MATNDNGTPGSPDQMDLDRLIGELETEAARRRAEPGYPHDADARLHFELARRAPNAARSIPLHDVVALVEDAAAAQTEPSPRSGARVKRSRRAVIEVLRQRFAQLDARVASLGLAAAHALHDVIDRIEDLEQRVRALEPPDGPIGPSPVPLEDSAALTQWRAVLAEGLPAGERVLYAQSDPDEIVAHLRTEGVDAYAVTDAGSPYRPGPDVRFASLLDHLRAVPDRALGAVVLAGLPEAMSPGSVAPLVAELGRVAGTVVIISEAPWWWRLRLGAVNADLALGRPLDPDTWLHAFHGVAMVGTAQYDPSGRSYRLVVGTTV